MHLDDVQAGLLKSWVIRKLEDISDADSDVLADYVLALVRGDDSLVTVRKNSIENLNDFLQDATESFVDEVITVVQTRAYDPQIAAQLAAQNRKPVPSGPRKRTFHDHDGHAALDGRQTGPGDRPIKQVRRGRADGERGTGQQNQQQWQMSSSQMGAPAMADPQETFAAFMAMQQALGFPPFPGMPQFNQNGQQGGAGGRKRPRCRDYDTKGHCARGAACRFEHDTDATGVGQSEQYDPTQPMLLPQMNGTGFAHTVHNASHTGMRGRGRGRGQQARSGLKRAEFSLAGPSQDKSLTALVIEQIPEDKLEEQQIREFFNQYGNVQTVDVQRANRLAIVTFDTWDQANAAYTSPKVIFDNRFVKVFWYKPGASMSNGQQIKQSGETQDLEMKQAEPEVDHEEIAKRQEEAQRKHEENKRQREEVQKQKSDIDAKLKAMEAERKKIAELVARRANKTATAPDGTATSTTESEQTRGLKAQLAKLEAEAKSLGLDPEPTADDGHTDHSWRRGGGYRGRAGFAARGRGSYRGAWNGGSTRGGAVKRLDNRPKSVAVVFPDGTFDEYDEALRQYLLFSGNLEHATMSRHADRPDAAMVNFEERYRAENFMAAIKGPDGIPNIGAIEVSWVTQPAIRAPDAALTPVQDSVMDISEPSMTIVEADYDIAEE